MPANDRWASPGGPPALRRMVAGQPRGGLGIGADPAIRAVNQSVAPQRVGGALLVWFMGAAKTSATRLPLMLVVEPLELRPQELGDEDVVLLVALEFRLHSKRYGSRAGSTQMVATLPPPSTTQLGLRS